MDRSPSDCTVLACQMERGVIPPHPADKSPPSCGNEENLERWPNGSFAIAKYVRKMTPAHLPPNRRLPGGVEACT